MLSGEWDLFGRLDNRYQSLTIPRDLPYEYGAFVERFGVWPNG